MQVSFRSAMATDAAFLTEMLVAAAYWRPEGPPGTVAEVLAQPELAHYIVDWPQPRDLGVIAAVDRPVGAAWLRFFSASDPGFGFVGDTVPELSMGMVREWRGRGVGRQLLDSLLIHARHAGLPAVSLSVEPENYAVSLYRQAGFQPVGRVQDSLTMLLYL